MRGRILVTLAAVVLIFSLVGNAHAELYRITLDVFTTNYTNPAQQQLNIWLPVYDTSRSHGPDFVSNIKVKAPDGSVLFLDRKKDWLPYDRVYWKAFYAADFVTKKIPAGVYTVTVTPTSGLAISETDSVAASFLPIPKVTSPSNNANGVTETLTFTWNAVAGATYYRVQLWNDSWNEPVYWTWDKQHTTDLTHFTLPAGVLKTNCQYKLRIEARSGTQDLDQRSRCEWITFNTGSW
jgi:hypothetical protein